MKVLITGGAGFQGSHIAERLLAAGHTITILNTYSANAERNIASFADKITCVWGSITDKEIVEKTAREDDVIFHLAAHIHVDESIADPRSTVEVNVLGTLNILEAARKYGKRVIHGSSCEVYGAIKPQDTNMNEEYELRPFSPYAASKAAADRLCYAYFKTYGLNVSIVRPFNIFGERQKEIHGGALIPILVHRALRREPLRVFGTGQQGRDYMYISDLVDAYILILNKNDTAGEVVNFGSGRITPVIDIINYIAKKLNAQIEYAPARPGEVTAFVANIEKARSINFVPKVSIWDGIDRYIDWRKRQPL